MINMKTDTAMSVLNLLDLSARLTSGVAGQDMAVTVGTTSCVDVAYASMQQAIIRKAQRSAAVSGGR